MNDIGLIGTTTEGGQRVVTRGDRTVPLPPTVSFDKLPRYDHGEEWWPFFSGVFLCGGSAAQRTYWVPCKESDIASIRVELIDILMG